jgi:hypothetical protein
MNQESIASSLLQRVKDRSNLLMVALLGGTFCTLRFLDANHPFSLPELVLPFILLFAHLVLAPIPWQWTGDKSTRAGNGRGVLQALFFNGLWTMLLFVLLALPMGHPGGPSGIPFPPPPEGPRPPLPNIPFWMINLAFAIVFGFLHADREAKETREKETAELLRQSQSRALQSQLDPHVLYNALTGLTELVYEDPLAAEDVINKLGELYRMLSVHGKGELVLLGEERRLVEAYLAMEQMRLGERLRVAWNWPAWADSLSLPPLLLQPVVENAIKHGISPSGAGGDVSIACEREGAWILLRVENTGKEFQPGAPLGIGLGNLAARLELWTGMDAKFSLESQDGRTIARLRWRLA